MYRPEDFRLDGQVAVVTGAGAGIGQAIAQTFAAAGAAVLVSDLSLAAAEGVRDEIVAAGGQAAACACDVTDETQLAQLVEHCVDDFGKLTLLVSNAGGGGPKAFDMPMADFRRAYELNVFFSVSPGAVGGSAYGAGRWRSDAGDHLDGRREPQPAHGLLRLFQGRGQSPDPQHRFRPGTARNPR